jgi:hypothetical protein
VVCFILFKWLGFHSPLTFILSPWGEEKLELLIQALGIGTYAKVSTGGGNLLTVNGG